ncbi:MAG: phage tail tube protein [Alphaproteobacteria bacterium]
MSKSPNERLGYCDVKINGTDYELREVVRKLPGIRRDDIDEGNAFAPVKEGGFIKGKAYLKRGQSIQKINELDNATVSTTDNLGNAITFANGWVKNNPEVSKDGFDLEIGVAYGDCTEVTGG